MYESVDDRSHFLKWVSSQNQLKKKNNGFERLNKQRENTQPRDP